DFLLASDLSSREIVLGKLLARLAPPALLLLAGLPVLSLVQLLGGADPLLILGGVVLGALSAVGPGSVAVFVSVFAAEPWGAALRTYLTAAGYFLLSTCCFMPLMYPTGSLPELGTAARIATAGNPFNGITRLRQVAHGDSPAEVLAEVLGDSLIFNGLV